MRVRRPLVATLLTTGLTSTALVAAMQPGAPAAADQPGVSASGYTVTVDSTGPWAYPDDTPASSFLDADGTYHYQQAHSLYGATDPREWMFFTGRTIDDAAPDAGLNRAVDPSDPTDRNDDTTGRCNNSPTGVESTYAPGGSGYAQRNYCDLVGVWVDPDTGDWYGLVHNEFTPQPFGDGLHYDAIDYAVSHDRGHTWTIEDHVITSPYSTKRGDTAAFPQQTYYYGDGDPRLFVDTASGYFYVFYGSRVVDKGGSWKAFYEHVARAPISAKMRPDSWHKWYAGRWAQPGVGGKESNMTPVTATSPAGYTAPDEEYDPANPGTSAQQIAAGTMPATSPLFVMDVTYDAYLGLYIGEPQAVDQSGNAPQEIYATDNLATEKWVKLGDTGSYHTASWYRWFLDDANATSSTIVGKGLRMYCSIACAQSDDEYAKVTVDSTDPASPVRSGGTYRIATGDRLALGELGRGRTSSTRGRSAHAEWTFTSTGDGAYTIANRASGRLLGVDDTTDAGRAWGAKPTTEPADGQPGVGQQWFVVRDTDPASGRPTGTFHLVNRYSGLVLALSSDRTRAAETVPTRTWADRRHSAVGRGRTAGEQTLTLSQVRRH